MVTAVSNEVWHSNKEARFILPKTFMVKSLPPMQDNNSNVALLGAAVETAAEATKAIMSSMAILNIFMSASLSMLWGMVNAL